MFLQPSATAAFTCAAPTSASAFTGRGTGASAAAPARSAACERPGRRLVRAPAAAKPPARALAMSGVPRNPNFGKLQAGYLFPEIARRRDAYLAEHPAAQLISLGIGDTTSPIPEHIRAGLEEGARKLGTREGYTGYGEGEGMRALRDKIAARLYSGIVGADEIFVSDGAKCDIGRLQMVFGGGVSIAVQDPSYPVYVDTAVMQGQTAGIEPETRQFRGIAYMRCDSGNGFFPDLAQVPRTDLVFFCSPNNPTGAAASRQQLEELVAFARRNRSIIIYDAAYAPFIRSDDTPRSIFEIPGAREVAIECNSFSKYAGFTGVRLGWTAVPKELRFADGTPVISDFGRVMNTCFNGASNIAQHGGLACLDDAGLLEIRRLTDGYMANARMMRETMLSLGFAVYGGTDAPYVWVNMPGKSSWDVFADILQRCEVVTVPGAGFGPGGEGFVRLSAFASPEACTEAMRRIQRAYAYAPSASSS